MLMSLRQAYTDGLCLTDLLLCCAAASNATSNASCNILTQLQELAMTYTNAAEKTDKVFHRDAAGDCLFTDPAGGFYTSSSHTINRAWPSRADMKQHATKLQMGVYSI